MPPIYPNSIVSNGTNNHKPVYFRQTYLFLLLPFHSVPFHSIPFHSIHKTSPIKNQGFLPHLLVTCGFFANQKPQLGHQTLKAGRLGAFWASRDTAHMFLVDDGHTTPSFCCRKLFSTIYIYTHTYAYIYIHIHMHIYIYNYRLYTIYSCDLTAEK